MVSGGFRLSPGGCNRTPQSAGFLQVLEAGGRGPWVQAGPVSHEAPLPVDGGPWCVLAGREQRAGKLWGLLEGRWSHHEAPRS